MSDRLGVAERLAETSFAGRLRLNDDTAIAHSRRVAALVRTEHEKTVALLHDVIEDTGLDPFVIRMMFGPEVYADVLALTRDADGKSYNEYIETLIVSGSPSAVRVKLADLTDNLNGAPPDLRRRYMRAMTALLERRVLAQR